MKRFGVEWAQPASKDLENIIDYISQDNIDTAITIFEKIKSKCSALNQFPDRGRIVPELKAYGILSYRELIVSPWRVICRTSNQKIHVLAVLDSRRSMDDILIERFL
ncbi:type II toxin-antitoxin system RelE/ParE family toxin [Candidatus Methylomirabilis sp.]